MEHVLEDDLLRVKLVPDEGGRISSIKSLTSGVEFLLQAQPDRGPLPTGMKASFEMEHALELKSVCPA